MFTGIIQSKALVDELHILKESAKVVISHCFDDLERGESIAVNGVCLTVTDFNESTMSFDISPETLAKTNLGQLKPKARVNLERSLRATDKLGGHFLLGHVDEVVKVYCRRQQGEFIFLELGGFNNPALLVTKGSIAIDGISLTINEINQNNIRCMIVPHTLTHTNLAEKRIDDDVNIEYDYLAKIVSRQQAVLNIKQELEDELV